MKKAIYSLAALVFCLVSFGAPAQVAVSVRIGAPFYWPARTRVTVLVPPPRPKVIVVIPTPVMVVPVATMPVVVQPAVYLVKRPARRVVIYR